MNSLFSNNRLALRSVFLCILLISCGRNGTLREDQIPTVTSIPLIATRDSIRATAISENQSEFETAIARPSATSLPAFTPYPTPQAIDSPTGIYSDCETARLVARMENCWLGRQGDLYLSFMQAH